MRSFGAILLISSLLIATLSVRLNEQGVNDSKVSNSTSKKSQTNLRNNESDKKRPENQTALPKNQQVTDQLPLGPIEPIIFPTQSIKDQVPLGPIPPIIFPTGSIFLEDQPQPQYIPKQDQSPPQLGGWQKLNTDKPKGLTLEIDQMIKNKFPIIKDQSNLKLITAEKQVVYGWNYHFIYQGEKEVKNDNGTINKVSSTYQFYCYQEPDKNTADSLVQTYEEKVITTDQKGNIVTQGTVSVSGDDLNAKNVPDLQNMNAKEQNFFEELEQQQNTLEQELQKKDKILQSFIDDLFGTDED